MCPPTIFLFEVGAREDKKANFMLMDKVSKIRPGEKKNLSIKQAWKKSVNRKSQCNEIKGKRGF